MSASTLKPIHVIETQLRLLRRRHMGDGGSGLREESAQAVWRVRRDLRNENNPQLRSPGEGKLVRPQPIPPALRTYGTDGTSVERQIGGYAVADGAARFTIANPDFTVRSLRGNAVMRWEWRPGSTLYVVWQQDRSARDALAREALGSTFEDLLHFGSLDASQTPYDGPLTHSQYPSPERGKRSLERSERGSVKKPDPFAFPYFHKLARFLYFS